MRLARFGDTWASAYTFDQYDSVDTWDVSRPPVVTPVGGVGGAFDHYGIDNYPVAPITLRKSFRLSTAADVELLSLMQNCIAAGRSKLWRLLEDGATYHWTWAKCSLHRNPRSVLDHRPYQPIELEFFAPEGLWYAATASGVTDSGLASGAVASNNVVNNGNYPALVDIEINSTNLVTAQAVGSDPSMTWLWSDPGGHPLGNVEVLWVTASQYYCKYRVGISALWDGYVGFTPPTTRVEWLISNPGTHDLQLTATTNGGATWGYSISYYSTYL